MSADGDGDETEPFDQGNTELPPEPEPPVRNSPAVVARAAATADRLFPTLDFGAKVHQLAGNFDVPVLEAALLDAHSAGKRTWNYIVGCYKARMNDGRGASTPNAPSLYRPQEKPSPRLPSPSESDPVGFAAYKARLAAPKGGPQ